MNELNTWISLVPTNRFKLQDYTLIMFYSASCRSVNYIQSLVAGLKRHKMRKKCIKS